ncbi:methylmalonyl-CoA mutase family protein [Candidatus Poriferisodalis sp.]|uniref:methylmalonyl-CoA mutase family protein n=1 Tax=Candidatus Poriferisodalis sp. TaxID=3101277 RepID=UPI003B014AF6
MTVSRTPQLRELRDLLDDSGFAGVGETEWASAAESALRGAALSSLDTLLPGGIATGPLYSPHRHSTADDPVGLPGAAPHVRGAAATSGWGSWEVRQIHDVTLAGTPDAVAVDTTAGVDAVTVARGWDPQRHADALAAGIGDAAAAGVTVHLQSGTTAAHVAALTDAFESCGADATRQRSWLGMDPIAGAASGWSGHASAEPTAELTVEMCNAARSATDLAQRMPHAVPLEADGSVFADAGATDATELAAMLATGAAWLRVICDHASGPGRAVDAAARLLGFTVSAGPDPYQTTAKCRALRWCWSRMLGACGVGDGALRMRLHAVTSTAMLSALDPWINMLRATTAAFGAANGGVDAITVRPFDHVSAGPTSSSLGWRVAANTQLILRHESRLGSVIDPAGGSWYLEELTRTLAHAAWDRFRSIESAGGVCAALAGGALAEAIAEDRAQRDERIAAGDYVLVGVTAFTEPRAHSPHDDAQRRASCQAVQAVPADTLSCSLGTHRWAAPHETGDSQTEAAH